MLKGSCSVCSHPDLRAIVAARDGGAGLRAVANQFGVSTSSLGRHEQHGKPKPARRRKGPPTAAELAIELPCDLPDRPAAVALRELADLHRGALETYEGALKDKDRRNVSALLLQLRRNLELRARLEAQLRPDDRPPAERLAVNPEWAAFRGRFLALLDRRPDLKTAVIEDLEGFLAETA